MSDLAIRFENVGKEYRVGAASPGGRYNYQSLGERLAGTLRNPLSAAAGVMTRPPSDSFWALKDVSFDVKRGEVVGVIGRNGAGKSTLLKILSQITRPTEGQIEVHGRVGSLLEVGTGFHPELTGRENVFLNGAILGMTQREVRAKFDEIVAFSEVERFLDTPVKQYSSGMYTRLAFAVAAHLDPEILVVDEVLAVGDAEFQKKCLGKMQDVASGGRTVLFVSHNMGAIRELCTSCAYLTAGALVCHLPTEEAINAYLNSGTSLNNVRRKLNPTPDQPVQINSIWLHNQSESPHFNTEDTLHITLEYLVPEDVSGTAISLAFRHNGSRTFEAFDTDYHPELLRLRPSGRHTATLAIPGSTFTSGRVSISLAGIYTARARFADYPDILQVDLADATDNTHTARHSARHNPLQCPGKWRTV